MAAKKSLATATRRRRDTVNETSTPSSPDGVVSRAIETTMRSGEALTVGVVHLVSSTIRAAVTGAQDVGKEIGSTAVATVRGSIKAANDIGGDLAIVAERVVKGTVDAAGEIGRELMSTRKPGAAVASARSRRPAATRSKRRTA